MPETSANAPHILPSDREYLLERGIVDETVLANTGATVMTLVAEIKGVHKALTKLGVPERGFAQRRCHTSEPWLMLSERLDFLTTSFGMNENKLDRIHEMSKPRPK